MLDCIAQLISIHAPREGSDAVQPVQGRPAQISIHAPREGSDVFVRPFPQTLQISIHAPREGSDKCRLAISPLRILFLSTLPARGATYERRAQPQHL